MKMEGWETNLNNYLEKEKNIKYELGKNDCWLFIVKGIKIMTGKEIFKENYKNHFDVKKIFIKNKCKNLYDLGYKIFKENNFKDNIISLAQRGDIVFFKERTDCNIEFGGAFGICVGSRSILKCKEKLVNVDTMQGDISWRL